MLTSFVFFFVFFFFTIFLATSLPVKSCSRLLPFTFCLTETLSCRHYVNLFVGITTQISFLFLNPFKMITSTRPSTSQSPRICKYGEVITQFSILGVIGYQICQEWGAVLAALRGTTSKHHDLLNL